MLAWRDIVIFCLDKKLPRDIVSHILLFLRRESIHQSALESRDYHEDRMPRVERLFYADYDTTVITDDYYLNIKVNDVSEEEACLYSKTADEFIDKWDTIDPKGKEYTYMDIWRWDSFNYPYMNYIYAFNRGRIFLKLLKGYEWYDLNSEDNIVDKLTDYEELK